MMINPYLNYGGSETNLSKMAVRLLGLVEETGGYLS